MIHLLTGDNYGSLFREITEITRFDYVRYDMSMPAIISYINSNTNSSRKLEFEFSKMTYLRSINYSALYNAPWVIDVFSSMSI